MNYASPDLYFKQKKAALTDALHSVLERGRFILGKEVGHFENAFSDYNGVAYCTAVNSGNREMKLSRQLLRLLRPLWPY